MPNMRSEWGAIEVRGTRENNLRDLSLDVPKRRLTVFTGVSGSGMQDVDHLIGLLDRLVEDGRTVIVIEHNLAVVARADWVIDLGPGAGHDGGRVIFEGPPSALVRADGSLTGEHLLRWQEPTASGARS